jgi:hypothetical protein
MWHKLAIAATAAVSIGVAAMPTGVMAAHGGGHGGGGHGGFSGGGFSGGGRSFSGFSAPRSFSAPSGFSRGVPNAASVNRGVGTQTFVNRSITNTNRSITSAPLAGRRVISNGRWAWIGGHRRHGRRIHAFIPGIGIGWYWYYDDCYVLTDDYGWINICGYNY